MCEESEGINVIYDKDANSENNTIVGKGQSSPPNNVVLENVRDEIQSSITKIIPITFICQAFAGPP